MKFETAATTNPIDQLKVIGIPTDRIDGPLKTTGHVAQIGPALGAWFHDPDRNTIGVREAQPA